MFKYIAMQMREVNCEKGYKGVLIIKNKGLWLKMGLGHGDACLGTWEAWGREIWESWGRETGNART